MKDNPGRLVIELVGPPGEPYKAFVRDVLQLLSERGYAPESAEALTRDQEGRATHTVVLVCSSTDLGAQPPSAAGPS